ncbi:MAG: FecR domain-containing protein [Bacteroidota bacterium]
MAKQDVELLKQFLRGNCTAEEVQRVVSWINSDDADKQFLQLLQDYSSEEEVVDLDSENLYQNIWSRIGKESDRSSNLRITSKSAKPSNTVRRLFAFAASISIVCLSFWSVYKYYPQDDNIDQVATILEIVKSAEVGQKRQFTLPDGTKIKLNSGSSIRYTQKDFSKNRKVHLNGEAFFDVTKDPKNPFEIRAENGLKVKVLGTSFVVNTNREKSENVVAVRSGKVRVEHTGEKTVYLEKGQRIRWNTNSLMKEDFSDYLRIFGWVDNKLVFHRRDMPEVFADIGDWFGVKVSCESDFSDLRPFQATFENPSLKEVLESVCYAYNLKYEIQNDYVKIW